MTLLDKVLVELKAKPVQYVVIVILTFFAFNGVRDYWQDFKHDIMIEELEARGIVLQEQEGIILQRQAVIDSNIKAQTTKVATTDVQAYKNKNDKAKEAIRKSKGLVITDDDITSAQADELVTKWTTKK